MPNSLCQCGYHAPPVVAPLLAEKNRGEVQQGGGYNRAVRKFSFVKQAKIFFGGFAAISKFSPGGEVQQGGAWYAPAAAFAPLASGYESRPVPSVGRGRASQGGFLDSPVSPLVARWVSPRWVRPQSTLNQIIS